MLRSPLPPRRAGRLPSADLITRRGKIVLAEREIAGVTCVVAGNENARLRILHFHGGGYRMGSATGWRNFADRLAAHTGAQVIVPDYALAPEQPYPAALHDGAAVLVALARSETPLILSGDSAGGGLALALATRLSAPTPLAALILISPWIDLRVTAESYTSCASSDPLFSLAAAKEAADSYLQGLSPDDPAASPLLADLSSVPPVLLMVSTAEVLRDDAVALAQRLVTAGIRTEILFEPGERHIWPVVSPDTSATIRSLDRMARFAAEVSATG